MSSQVFGATALRRWSVPAMVVVGAAAVLASAPAQAAPVGHTMLAATACSRSADPHAITCDLVDGPAAAGRSAVQPADAPVGYTPTDLQAAYHLTDRSANINGGLIAIVDPYDDPFAEGDLGQYRSHFNLPACTTANGCFSKVNQNGSSAKADLPVANPSWFREVSVDLDMVSAICPHCQILLVEANDILDQNMYAAEDYATSHAKFVSNSWSNPEDPGDASFDSHFNRPGVVITASTGDTGSGPRYPATNSFVVAVGGTSLNRSGSGFTESAWGGAGSGCSAFEPKPSWQVPVAGCANRAEADVSAVADPNTGVAIYDAGWLSTPEGGTSVAAPIIAATYALATPPRATDYPASYLYSHAGSLNDVTSGSNGGCGAPICGAGSGWDGPTGLGTPNTVGAFAWYSPLQAANPPGQTVVSGTAVSFNLAAFVSGGVAPYRWFPSIVNVLPPGLTLANNTGLITGTPTTPGTYTFCYEVLDSSAHGNWLNPCMTWVIQPSTVVVPDIVGEDLGSAQVDLGSVGLNLGLESDRSTTNCDLVGTVSGQNPGAGAVVAQGSFVNYSFWVLKSGAQCQ